MPWYQAGGMIIGAGIGASGAKSANRQQIQFAREMAKNKYQYTVQDLKAAGLNPMLAYQQGASAPSTPSMQNVGDAAMRGADVGGRLGASAKMIKEQLANVAADTNLKKSQAAAADASANAATANAAGVIIDNQTKAANLPYIERNAEVGSLTIDRNFQILGRQLEKLGYETGSAKLDLSQKEKMQPLLITAQRIANQLATAKIPMAEAKAMLWDVVPDKSTFQTIWDMIMDPSKLSEWGKQFEGPR